MQQDEIYEKLGISGASSAIKQQVIENIVQTVDLRFIGLVDDLLDEDQVRQLDSVVESSGDDSSAVTDWLKENIPQAVEIYEATLRDHVDELCDQLK